MSERLNECFTFSMFHLEGKKDLLSYAFVVFVFQGTDKSFLFWQWPRYVWPGVEHPRGAKQGRTSYRLVSLL